MEDTKRCAAPTASPAARGLPAELSFRGRIVELDGLRAVAVILVLFVHFGPVRAAGSPLWTLESLGWIGVDLFFVLSGFLITGVLLDSRDKPRFYSNFYFRRILRIFPLYYFLLVVASLAFIIWRPEPRHEYVHEAWWYFLYLGNLWPIFTPYLPNFLAPLWSLQIEEQFYVIFPSLVKNLKPLVLSWILIAVVVLSGPMRWAAYLWKPNILMLQYGTLPFRMDGLALGALMALRTRQGPWRVRPIHATALMIALLAALWAYLAWGGYDPISVRNRTFGFSVVALAFASVLLWVLRYRGTRPTAWLRSRPMQYVGKVSYGIYVLQIPAYLFAKSMTNHFGLHFFDPLSWHTLGWGAFGLVCAVTLTFASLSWYLLESPTLKAKDGLIRPLPRHPKQIALGT